MLPETLNEIALGVSRPATDLADDIYMLCEWIQAQGNRGYSLNKLVGEGMPVYFLDQPLLIADILFHAKGSRKSDYSGWGVKRNPMLAGEVWQWEQKWLSRFGHLNTQQVVRVQAKMDAAKNPGIAVGDWVVYQGDVYRVHTINSGEFILEDIYDYHGAQFAKRLELTKVDGPRRRNDRYAGGSLNSQSTFTIAYNMACAEVMTAWHRHEHYRHARDIQLTYGGALWSSETKILRDELTYRVHAAPPELESKKKTAAAAGDWAKASRYLEEGTDYFFSREFVLSVTQSPEYPDLTIDPEHLPKLPPDKTPIRWKSDRELMNDVMRWLNADIDPTIFEYDDRKEFIDVARRWLATAKGEKVKDV